MPNETNAHPHVSDRVAVVHNGIIENFRELREELEAKGHKFHTETDTEVSVHLITEYLNQGMEPAKAASTAIRRLKGAFALGIIFKDHEGLMIGARSGPPLAVGFGAKEMYLGSDAFALAPLTNKVAYLEDGDWAVIHADGVKIYDIKDRPDEPRSPNDQHFGKPRRQGRAPPFHGRRKSSNSPKSSATRLNSVINPVTQAVALPAMPFDLAPIPTRSRSISPAAPPLTRRWLRSTGSKASRACRSKSTSRPNSAIAKRRCRAAASRSSFRNRAKPPTRLAALRYCKEQGQHIASVVNVPGPSIARESEVIFPTHAGPEIGVASTKAFTCQLAVLAALAIAAGRARGTISRERELSLTRTLMEVAAPHDRALEPRPDLPSARPRTRQGARRALSRPRPVLSDCRWKAR